MPAKKQITREMILDAALRILRRNGWAAISVKALAAELQCSTQPLYLSFSGMEDLRRELVPVAVQEFSRLMAQQAPDGRVRLYGTGYVEFARREPSLFRFLFMRPGAFQEMKPVLVPIIDASVAELQQKYGIPRDEADFLHDQLWMQAHGIAAMAATGYCSWDMAKVERMLAQCQALFTQKYEAQHVHE